MVVTVRVIIGVNMIMIVIMIVMVIVGVRGATLAIHPARIPIDVMFFFPDRDTVFNFINDIACCLERFIPMTGADAYPNRHLAKIKIANSVHA
jgi:hypothetical protein